MRILPTADSIPQAITTRPVERTQQAHPPRALVDWFAYTTPDGVAPEDALPGYHKLDWTELDYGRDRYSRMRVCGHITICYDGQPGMGVHVNMSGQGCREAEGAGLLDDAFIGGWAGFMRLILDSGWHATRVDVALDDYDGLLDMERIRASVESDSIVTRYRRTSIDWNWGGAGAVVSKVIRFGSNMSDSLVRIYDKRLEQLNAGKDVSADHWVRCELQTRHKTAEAVCRLVAYSGRALDSISNIMAARVSPRIPSGLDSNRRRWAVESWWADFLEGARGWGFGLAPVQRTLESVSRWLERVVAPTLATYFVGGGRSLLKLHELVSAGERRMRPRHWAMLAETA